jgi:sulfate adenylyltransferase subunit 1
MLDTSLDPFVQSLMGDATGETDLLRFITAGSVNDGKSTLIGRLLYETKAVYEDQLVSIQRSGMNRSTGLVDLSLLTDSLTAEREQGITIDVAYRYFSTPRRKFIIADTPGHEQYTRNMATGASTAQSAVILIDAAKGLLPQCRKHIYIAALLGIEDMVAAVNKMDTVGYSEEVFNSIAEDFKNFCRQLGIPSVYAIPVSALKGDNIVQASSRTKWFDGSTLLEYLEDLPVTNADYSKPLRLPIQYVAHPDSRFRGFSGQIASGLLQRGETVTVFPSGNYARVKSISTFDGETEYALPGSSITVTLEDDIALSRGDVLAGASHLPQRSTSISAKLIWLDPGPCQHEKSYVLKHTTKIVRARVTRIVHRVDMETVSNLPASALQMNDIASVHIETSLPLFFDPYRQNRTMGSFILVDPITNATVAAGMIESSVEGAYHAGKASQGRVLLDERTLRNGHPPAALWMVGRHTLAEKLERAVFEQGGQVQLACTEEFRPGELNGAVTMLQRMGVITIFSLPTDDPDLRRAIAAIYCEESFFQAENMPTSDAEALTQMLGWLRTLQQESAIKTRQQ